MDDDLRRCSWFVADGGKVAHLPRRFSNRWDVWTYCANACYFGRPATPEDRRCKRCEERSQWLK